MCFSLGVSLTGLPARGVMDLDGLERGELHADDSEVVNELPLSNVSHTIRTPKLIRKLQKRYTYRHA